MTITSGRTVWHASRANIERPTIADRTVGGNHANSGLGIFCASGPHDYISGFGKHIFSLTLKDDLRVIKLTIPELRDLSFKVTTEEKDRSWFEEYGKKLSDTYDLIELVELDDFVSQVILLRDDIIISSKKFSNEEFKLFATDVFTEMEQHPVKSQHKRKMGP